MLQQMPELAWGSCFGRQWAEPLVAVVSAGRVEHSMRASMHILQGSFDPIMDANNNTDLLPLIIQAKVHCRPHGQQPTHTREVCSLFSHSHWLQ